MVDTLGALQELVETLKHSAYLVGQSSGFIEKLLVAECEPSTWNLATRT